MNALPMDDRRLFAFGSQPSALSTRGVFTESAIDSIAPGGGTGAFLDAGGYSGTFLYSVNDAHDYAMTLVMN